MKPMPQCVLGTRIEPARDDHCRRTLILSDLHVPVTGGRVFDDLAALLRDAASTASTRVLVLGDLFDAYVGPGQLDIGIWRSVCEILAETSRAGVSITVLHGNRDFMLDVAFERRAGCRVVAGGLSFSLAGRRCLALHGDELCLRDLPYQRSKRWLRHPVTRTVLRHLPLAISLAMARQARRKSARSIQRGDQSRFDPPLTGVQTVFQELGVELLVFGHIHRPARGRLGEGGEYCILPAFDAGGIHLEFDGAQLCYRDLTGARLPDFPPRVFP